MFHETTWKHCSTGAAAVGGGGPDGAGMAARQDRPSPEYHAAKCRTLDGCLPPRRIHRLESYSLSRPSAQVIPSAQADIGELSAARGHRVRVLHRPVDLSTNCRTDSASLGGVLPCRCDPASDGRAWFFPLKSLRSAARNATSKWCAGGLSGTGPESSDEPSERQLTWSSSTNRASCSTRWFVGPGPFAVKRQRSSLACGDAEESRPSAECRSRQAAGIWDGISSSMWTWASAKSKSWPSSVTCWPIFGDDCWWSGTDWEHTRDASCANGSKSVAGSTWNSCRPTLQSLTPTSMAGRTSSAESWPTIAQRTPSSYATRSWTLPPMQPASNRCSVGSFAEPNCRSESCDISFTGVSKLPLTNV